MRAYLLRRLAFAAFLVFAVSSASLLLTRLAPGDYATDVLGVGASDAERAELRARTGLDKSVGAQYVEWLSRAVRFDFGTSLAYNRPVLELITSRAFYTALLAVTAFALASIIGIPLGVLTGAGRAGGAGGAGRAGRLASPKLAHQRLASEGGAGGAGRLAARVVLPTIRGVSLLLISMPPLLTSLLLVFIAARTGWLPVGGVSSLDPDGGGAADIARHMIVPVLALALPLAAMFERLQAQGMREVIEQPFTVAAIARGVPRVRVIWRDAFKAALKPVASIYGLVMGTLLSGSFVVEIVTSWPGLGRLMLDALRARDVYLVAGCGAAASVFLAAGTLFSDAALALVDPRSRESS